MAKHKEIPVVKLDWITTLLETCEYHPTSKFIILPLLGIKIFMIGFSETELAANKDLINKNGAEVTRIADQADVIICDSDIDTNRKELLERQENTVTVEWLHDSIKQNRFVSLEEHRYQAKLFSETLDTFMLNSTNVFEGITFFLGEMSTEVKTKLFQLIGRGGGTVSGHFVPTVDLVVSEFLQPELVTEVTEFFDVKIIKPGFIAACLQAGKKVNVEDYAPAKFPELKQQVELKEFEDRIKSKLFRGYVFCVIERGFSPFEITQAKKNIIDNSGIVVDHVENTEELFEHVTHFIAADGVFNAIFGTWKGKTLVSTRFIERCIEKNEFMNVDNDSYRSYVHYRPLPVKTPISEFKKLKINVTGEDEEAYVIKKLLIIFGGNIQSKRFVCK